MRELVEMRHPIFQARNLRSKALDLAEQRFCVRKADEPFLDVTTALHLRKGITRFRSAWNAALRQRCSMGHMFLNDRFGDANSGS